MGNSRYGVLGLLVVLLVAAVLVVPVGSFFSSVGESAAQPSETSLRLGFLEQIDSLNPYLGLSDVAWIFYSLVYDSLTGVGADMRPAPGLAQSWWVVPLTDPEMAGMPYGSVWQYNLTRNATWTDGLPLTADDVVFTINLNAMNYDIFWAYQPYTFAIQEARKIDDYTVRMYYWDRVTGDPAPVAYGDQIQIPILPKHKLETLNPPEISFSWDGTFPEEEIPIVGTGPFIATPDIRNEFADGSQITLMRNPDYHMSYDYGKLVHFDKLQFLYYQDQTALTLALELGMVDFASLPPQAYRALKDDVDGGFVQNVVCFDGSDPSQYWTELGVCMNEAGPNMARLDCNVRQAMAHATNKSYIVDNYYLGLADEGSTLISPLSSDWHYELQPGEEFTYDLVYANTLLETSGYRDTNSDGIREVCADSMAYLMGWAPVGTPLHFELLVRREAPEEKDIAMYLQAIYQNIGIAIDFQVVDEATLAAIVYGYAYDMVIWYWTSDPDPNYQLFVQSTYSIAGWSDNAYSNPAYDENYTASVHLLNKTDRQQAVYNCQSIHYWDSPYIILAYVDQTVAWRNDTFVGWGDWAAEPGRSVFAYWTGNPLYFELTPAGEYNLSPFDVDFVADVTTGTVPQYVNFTASARDPDGDDLRYYIDYGDGTHATNNSGGGPNESQAAYFWHLYTDASSYIVMIWIDDGTGIPSHNVTRSLSIEMLDLEGTSAVDYYWYDMFNVPFGDWWGLRGPIYASDFIISDTYPYIYYHKSSMGYITSNYSNLRLSVDGESVSTVNTAANPEFVPYFGSEVGGHMVVDWYMQYLTMQEATDRGLGTMNDGWLLSLNGTVTMDRQAAKGVFNISDAEFDSFGSWWGANEVAFEGDYRDWLLYEGSTRLDIWPMYDYDLMNLRWDLEAVKTGEAIELSYDHVSWGFECLMARWLHEVLLPSEHYFEDMSFHAEIGPAVSNITMDTVVCYALFAYETIETREPCWVWQGMLGDYLPSDVTHPLSEYDPYEWKERPDYAPGAPTYGTMVLYEYTPASFDLGPYDSLTFEWPADELLFFDHVEPGIAENVTGHMHVVYSEPLGSDFPDQIMVDGANRTITFAGPMDLADWSQTQTAHAFLESEWDRVGLLPYGMPWVEFSMYAGNTPPVAVINVTPSSGNISTVFTFDASASYDEEDNVTDLQASWDFDDDGSWDASGPASVAVNHSYSIPGNYTVVLEVSDTEGMSNTTTVVVMVYDVAPNAAFTVTPSAGNISTVFQFDASNSSDLETPSADLEVRWDFEDDGVWDVNWTANKTTTHVFDAVGNYPVRLQVRDSLGAVDEATGSVSIVNTVPNALIVPSAVSGTIATLFTFDASGSSDLEDPLSGLTVRWDFEDDGTWDVDWTSSKTTTHVYSSVGTYTVHLQVRDSGGLVDDDTEDITIVNTVPTASFTWTPDTGNISTLFQFNASGCSDLETPSSALEVRWDWESDGTWDFGWTSFKLATHQYSAPGTYNVTMEVRDMDGSSSAVSHLVDVYNEAPVAAISITPGSGIITTEFTLNASGSNDLEDPPTALEVRWDFEDDGVWDLNWTTNKTTTHVFGAVGNYTVRLQVRDSLGEVDDVTESVSILNTVPNALIIPSSVTGTIATVFTFDASGSSDLEDSLAQLMIRWDFEDDGTWDVDWTTGKTTTHVYSAVGTYTVRLQVRDSLGLIDDDTEDITIVNTAPSASFTRTPTTGNISTVFQFDASGSSDLENSLGQMNVRWDFEDDGTWDVGWTSVKTTSHVFGTVGTYTIRLQVRDTAGLTDDATLSVVVANTAPVASFSADPTTANITTTVQFDASACSDLEDAVGALRVRWDFDGDGTWDTGYDYAKTAQRLYTSLGTFTVKVQVIDSRGLTDIDQIVIEVTDDRPPVTQISVAGTSGQNGWLVSSVLVTLSASDDASGVASISYRVDTGSWVTYSVPFAIASNGIHTVEYRATDQYGNVETVRSSQIKVDTVLPVAGHSISGTAGQGGWYVSGVRVGLAGVDSESGMQSVMYRVDGGSWQAYSTEFEIFTGGTHVVEYYPTDLAGNVGSTHSVSVSLDASTPTSTISLAGTMGDGGWYISALTVTLNASDTGSGVDEITYAINGGSYSEYETPLLLSLTGIYVIDCTSYDVAGNGGAHYSQTVKVDLDSPEISVLNSDDIEKITSSTVNITWTTTDVGSGVKLVLVRVDGSVTPYEVDGDYYVLEGLSDGDHEIELVVVDNAGNTGSVTVQVNVNTSVFSMDGPAGPWVMVGLIALMLAIVVILLLMMLRRRRSGGGE